MKSILYKDDRYIVYENIQEFEASGKTLKSIDEAQPGDYIITSNGYYMPLINIKTHDMSKKGYILYRYTFPRHQYVRRFYLKTQTFVRMIIKYRDEGREPYQNVFLTAKMKLMVEFMKSGLDMLAAFTKVYKIRGINKTALMFKLMENKRLVQYMIKELDMNDLKKGLINAGVDAEWLGKMIKEHLENDKSSDSIKKHFFDFAAQAIGKNEESKQDESIDNIIRMNQKQG